VVYAGAFRSYGQILIIDHGGRYHTLLAGLHEISATVGQWVLAGEPIATMSPLDNQRPELYLELRRTGEAIDPLPWLADIDSKVRG
jgi:septal ring factor EnvC (AmiA/AmiB activator)